MNIPICGNFVHFLAIHALHAGTCMVIIRVYLAAFSSVCSC